MSQYIERSINPEVVHGFFLQTVGDGSEAPLSILIHLKQIKSYLNKITTLLEPQSRTYRDSSTNRWLYTDFYEGFVYGGVILTDFLPQVCDVPSLLRHEMGTARKVFQLRAEAVFSPPRRIDPDPFKKGFDHAFDKVFQVDQFTRGFATAFTQSWEPVVGIPYKPDQVKGFFRFLLTADLA